MQHLPTHFPPHNAHALHSPCSAQKPLTPGQRDEIKTALSKMLFPSCQGFSTRSLLSLVQRLNWTTFVAKAVPSVVYLAKGQLHREKPGRLHFRPVLSVHIDKEVSVGSGHLSFLFDFIEAWAKLLKFSA